MPAHFTALPHPAPAVSSTGTLYGLRYILLDINGHFCHVLELGASIQDLL